MPERFVFRQVDYRDVGTFLADGEIRSKNHADLQRCHRASFQEIVDRRGTSEFEMPNGGGVNDYVPFYFCPITSFTYTIYKRNVPLISPNGDVLGKACEDDRVFFVARPGNFRSTGVSFCFSDFALNSQAPLPTIETNLDLIEKHVHWNVFDESLDTAKIPEIGYLGVCRWFHNMASPSYRMTRSSKRMAEFLVHDAVRLDNIGCIIVKTGEMREQLAPIMEDSNWNIPIYVNRGCYFG